MTKEYRRKDVIPGLLSEGKCRAMHLLDASNSSQYDEMRALCEEVSITEPDSFWTIIDAKHVTTPQDWCSQFARNLRTNTGANPIDLANFALSVGKSQGSFGWGVLQGEEKDNPTLRIATNLANHFSKITDGSPKLILCIRGVDDLSLGILKWLSGDLNHALRNEPAFRNTRFLFSSKFIENRLTNFFNTFGFEKVRCFQVPKEHGVVHVGDGDYFPEVKETENKSFGVTSESKRLIIKKNKTKLINENISRVTDNQEHSSTFLSSFSEDEKVFLCLLAYPDRASRYTLEHFTDPRTAALCFNWLKRKPAFFAIHSSGDLILTENLRAEARAYHKSTDLEKSESWEEAASVLNLFIERFPFADDHSIAINLQAFNSFDSKLLRSLFNKDELSEIDRFVQRNEEQLIMSGKQIALTDEAKMVTRRYMETSGRAPLPELLNRVREVWLEDQEKYAIKKQKLDNEKKNLSTEIEDTLNQIIELKNLKDKLLEEFKNPQRFKAEKTFNFTTSKTLIVVGLSTCGASILFETLSTYHAACGLALTLFGFFWPNVEVKNATAGSSGPQSNLAIETQERSLKHRIAGLANRTGVMKVNLEEVDKQISNLGERSPSPYLDLSE